MIKPKFYKQGDKKWSGYSWKGATVARNGCGPSAIANSIAVLSELKHTKATPLSAFKWLCKHGYMDPIYGTYYSGISTLLKAYGVKKVIHTSNFSKVKKHLKKGDHCICLCGKSRWTSSGHYITAYGMDGNNVLISDSASSAADRAKAPFSVLKAAVKAHPYPQVWIIDNTAQYISTTNKIAKQAIKRAEEHHKYKRGGWSWETGIECHAFVGMVHKEVGYTNIYDICKKSGFYKHYDEDSYLGEYRVASNIKGVSESKLKPGDIVITSYKTHHSAIYVGNGKVAEAVGSGTRIGKYGSKYVFAYRATLKTSANSESKPENSPGKKSVKGFDISYVQNGLTLSGFKKAKKAGWEFVIIRLGTRLNGKLYTDKEFESKYKNAKEAGLKIGIYFYSLAATVEAAKKEANYVLKVLNNRELHYPIFIDFEDPKAQSNLGMKKSKQICEAFCKVIEDAGYDAGVYSFYNWLVNKISPISDKYYVWLAQYNNKDTYSGRHEMWQYSSTASVPGIGKPIDVNVSSIPFGSYPVKSKKKADKEKTKKKVTYPTLPKRGYFTMKDKGVNVKRLQTLLTSIGYKLKIDGVYGNETASIVRRFQKDKDLTVDGVFGKKSLDALKKATK